MPHLDDFTPKPGHKIRLDNYDADYHGDFDKESAKAATRLLQEKLRELQERLYAESQQSLLIVLQAMDTGGKDGAIEKVFGGINPLGVRVAAFKAPTSTELAQDFLWRVHKQVPPKGYIGIFNRSQYEEVLVVRVNKLVPKTVWKGRYDHINNFEHLLADTGTRILKFYLHISKAEQKERLQARLADPKKHWKFSLGDLAVREQWGDYMKAYEDALTRCNTEYAPWLIVPANHKWYRDWFIVHHIVKVLEEMNPKYPQPQASLENVVVPD